LMRRAKRWKKRYRRISTPELKQLYHPAMKQAQKDFDDAIKRAKQDSWRSYVSNQDRESVWSQVYRICRNHRMAPPATIKMPDDSFTHDAQSTADYLLNRFLPDDDPENDDHHQQTLRNIAECNCSVQAVYVNDDLPFSHEEIADVVERQNDKKSPGEDGLSANIIKVAYRHAGDVFDRLFNYCLKLRCFPSWFKSSIVKAML